MQFRHQLRYHLIRLLRCSHDAADTHCRCGEVSIDGIVETNARRILEPHEEIRFQDTVLRKGIQRKYLLFYKPNGYECTTNRAITHNMYELIPEEFQDLFPLGRLDINSEGLLLLTNDGQTYKELMNTEAKVEKEYIVTTWHPVTEELEKSFTEPFQLGPRITLPAVFEQLDTFRFRVVLTEGINRHIRRICAKNENQVRQLVRVRFGKIVLGDLKPGEWLGVEGFVG